MPETLPTLPSADPISAALLAARVAKLFGVDIPGIGDIPGISKLFGGDKHHEWNLPGIDITANIAGLLPFKPNPINVSRSRYLGAALTQQYGPLIKLSSVLSSDIRKLNRPELNIYSDLMDKVRKRPSTDPKNAIRNMQQLANAVSVTVDDLGKAGYPVYYKENTSFYHTQPKRTGGIAGKTIPGVKMKTVSRDYSLFPQTEGGWQVFTPQEGPPQPAQLPSQKDKLPISDIARIGLEFIKPSFRQQFTQSGFPSSARGGLATLAEREKDLLVPSGFVQKQATTLPLVSGRARTAGTLLDQLI